MSSSYNLVQWVMVESAPPTFGSWPAGMGCVDPTGNAFVCIQAGTPGVWMQIGGGTGGLEVPNHIALGYSFFVPDNVQVTYSSVIYVEAGGVLGTEGNGVLSWVN
jgi:hypothetical protein